MRKLLLFLLAVGLLGQATAENLPPSVMYSTLLNGMTLQEDGRLRFSRLTGYFLPRPSTATGSQYLYNPDDGAPLNILVKKADGTTVATFGAYAMPHDKVAWRMDTFRNLADKSLEYQFTEAGDYVLDLQIDGKTFQRMPFSVKNEGSDDPYSGGSSQWTLDGDWADYGYIHIPNNSASSTVAFKRWVQGVPERTVLGSAKIVGPGGTVVGVSPEAQYNLKSRWARTAFNFRKPGDGSSLTGGELTAKPGKYHVVLVLDGKTFKYPYTVSGGKLVREGRQSFQASPETRIEGGRDSWWSKSL